MPATLAERVKASLRAVPNHPKAGITFQDITPVLQDRVLFRQTIIALADPYRGQGITHILGIEARGFILAAPVAVELGAGFIPARKPGKLPWHTLRHDYELEYGTDALEAHQDAFAVGARVLVVDDVLATGGTAEAAGQLVRRLGGEVVGWSFLLELGFLKGATRLAGAPRAAILVL